MIEDDEDQKIYNVVVNNEEQWSIWPSYKSIPAGWKFGGKEGSKEECLAFIKSVWTDLRPRTLREQMEKTPRVQPDTLV